LPPCSLDCYCLISLLAAGRKVLTRWPSSWSCTTTIYICRD
jgi:hypothetical protein